MDVELRRLERAVAAGDVDAVPELARLHLRRGDEALAYVLLWTAGTSDDERGELGGKVAARQRGALEALGGRPFPFQVASGGRRGGHGPWSIEWRWTSVERALSGPPAPVLALRVDRSVDPARLEGAVRGLETLVALELLVEEDALADLPSVLGRARLLASLRLRGARVTARDLDRLRPALGNLVHVGLLAPGVGARPVTDPQLEALARFPRLECVELRGWTGLARGGLSALARAPSMSWIDADGCAVGLPALRAAALAGRTEVGFGPPLAALSTLLPGVIGREVRRLLDACRDALDARARRVAREVSRAVLLAEDPGEARRAAVPLLALGLERDAREGTLRAAVALAEEGVEGSELLPGLARARRGGLAELAGWALRRCVLHGWRPSANLLEGDEELRCLDAASRRAPAPVRSALEGQTRWHVQRPATRALHQALERGLGSGDAALESAAGEAALALAGSGPAALGFMVRAGLGGDARALEAIAPLVHSGLPLGPDALERLGACLREGDTTAPLAGRILWAAARRGHDLAPALRQLAGRAGPHPRWDVAGASPEVVTLLALLDVVEDLPAGVSTTRRHGGDDDGHRPDHAGRTCGACGSEDTTCVHHDSFGSNAGGSSEWESRCRRCALFTFEQHDWG